MNITALVEVAESDIVAVVLTAFAVGYLMSFVLGSFRGAYQWELYRDLDDEEEEDEEEEVGMTTMRGPGLDEEASSRAIRKFYAANNGSKHEKPFAEGIREIIETNGSENHDDDRRETK